MSFSYTLQYRPSTGGEHWWQFKELMKTNGWTVEGSGDGTTGGMDGQDRLDTSGSYSGSLDVDESWFVLQAPSGVLARQFMVQLKTPSQTWEVWYSSDGTGFAGGDATTRPSGSDEQQIMVSNTTHLPANNRYWSDYIIGDADEEYSFYVGVREHNIDETTAAFFMDVLTNTSSLDTDPAILGAAMNGSNESNYAINGDFFDEGDPTTSEGRAFGWYKKGFSDEAWVHYAFPTFRYEDGFGLDLWDDEATVDQKNGKAWEFNVFYSRHSNLTQAGFKGTSRLFKRTTLVGGGTRPYSDLSRITFRTISIPWDGSTSIVY